MKKNLTQRFFMTISMLAIAGSSLMTAGSALQAQELSASPSAPKSSTYVVNGAKANEMAGGSGVATISKDLYSSVCPAKNKCSMQGLYMGPAQAARAKEELKNKTILIDVRTLEEINYVGNTKVVDAYVPYVTLDGFQSVDKQKKSLKTIENEHFLTSIKKLVTAQGLNEKDPIILICRSGDRSAKAADLLTKAGYSQVYTVTEGFEGDLDSGGKRNVNGWKNSGLDWGYKFEEDKLVK